MAFLKTINYQFIEYLTPNCYYHNKSSSLAGCQKNPVVRWCCYIYYNNIVDTEKWTQSPFNEPEMDSFHFLGSTKLADSTHLLSAQ